MGMSTEQENWVRSMNGTGGLVCVTRQSFADLFTYNFSLKLVSNSATSFARYFELVSREAIRAVAITWWTSTVFQFGLLSMPAKHQWRDTERKRVESPAEKKTKHAFEFLVCLFALLFYMFLLLKSRTILSLFLSKKQSKSRNILSTNTKKAKTIRCNNNAGQGNGRWNENRAKQTDFRTQTWNLNP